MLLGFVQHLFLISENKMGKTREAVLGQEAILHDSLRASCQ